MKLNSNKKVSKNKKKNSVPCEFFKLIMQISRRCFKNRVAKLVDVKMY